MNDSGAVKVILWFVAVSLVMIGTSYITFPIEVLGLTGGFDLDASARVDVMATYGGVQVGLGVFLAFELAQKRDFSPLLRLLAIVFFAIGSIRLGASLIVADASTTHLFAAIGELSFAVLFIWLARKRSQ